MTAPMGTSPLARLLSSFMAAAMKVSVSPRQNGNFLLF
jgi:hypothetical protein